MHEAAISTIQNYADECFFEPKGNWRYYNFTERSYSRWAANEIIDRILEQEPLLPWDSFHQDIKTPIEVITEFIREMDDYAEISDNKWFQTIFQIAVKAAGEILLLLI